jgi:hypothetical protein
LHTGFDLCEFHRREVYPFPLWLATWNVVKKV